MPVNSLTLTSGHPHTWKIFNLIGSVITLGNWVYLFQYTFFFFKLVWNIARNLKLLFHINTQNLNSVNLWIPHEFIFDLVLWARIWSRNSRLQLLLQNVMKTEWYFEYNAFYHFSGIFINNSIKRARNNAIWWQSKYVLDSLIRPLWIKKGTNSIRIVSECIGKSIKPLSLSTNTSTKHVTCSSGRMFHWIILGECFALLMISNKSRNV